MTQRADDEHATGKPARAAVQKDKKLPAMQFYPGDWRKDIGVQSLSFNDRGIWFEMLMLMHDSERRGVLVLNGQPMSDEMIARAIGLDNQTFNQSLTTLLNTGVASREEDTGAVMNRRMVRDEHLRKIRAACGAKGGNPALLNRKLTTPDKGNETPSFSVSSSSSKAKTKDYGAKQSSAPEPSMFSLFKVDYEKAFHLENQIQPPWDAKEASQLSRWMKANPTITREQWQAILRNRAQSPVNHAAPLSKWIGFALSWLNGQGADDWGKQSKGGFNGFGNRGQQRTDGNIAAARRAAAAIAGDSLGWIGGSAAS